MNSNLLITMRKYIPIAIAIIAVLCVALLTQYRNESEKNPPEDINKKYEESREKIATDAKNWPEYQNDKLGITLKYPELTTLGKMGFIQAGNVLFVRTASSSLSLRQKELTGLTSDTAVLSKAKEIEKDDQPSSGTTRWVISFYENVPENNLQGVIDDRFNKPYGFQCLYGGLATTSEPGTYDIKLTPKIHPPDDGANEQGSCWINWASPILYSPEYKRVAVWDIGQNGSFVIPDCKYSCDADWEMLNSFRFIDKKVGLSNWKDFQSSSAHFKASFPEYPSHKTIPLDIPELSYKINDEEYTATQSDGTIYKVSYTDYGPGVDTSNPENNLSATVEGAVISWKGELISSKFSNFGNYKAIDYLIYRKDKNTYYKAKDILVGKFFYILLVAYKGENASNIQYDKFINSFQLK